MKRLIVNADDYGMAVGINKGIIESHQRGIVTSTTIMANGEALLDGIARLSEAPQLATGCHLVLIGGKPAAPLKDVRSLLHKGENFPTTLTAFITRIMTGQVKFSQLVTEFRAQLDKLYQLGLTLSHCDSHKHSHAHPMVLDAVIQVAEEYKIRYIRNPFEHSKLQCLTKLPIARGKLYQKHFISKLLIYYHWVFQMRMRETTVKCPDRFYGFVTTGSLSPEIMPDILKQIDPGISELMCHPAHLQPDLLNCATKLKQARERELAALTSPLAQQEIKAQKIKLISYQELSHH